MSKSNSAQFEATNREKEKKQQQYTHTLKTVNSTTK